MKFKFFTIAACAVFMLSSCNNNNGDEPGPQPGETKSAYLKINTRMKSRADEGSATGTSAELYSALIYFMDGASDPVLYRVLTAGQSGANLTMDELADGVLIEDIPSDVTQVYVVGNYDLTDENGNGVTFPTNLSLNVTRRLSDVQDVLLDIQQVSYGSIGGVDEGQLLSMMDGQAPLYVYEEGGSNQWNGTTTPGDGDSYANVTISPIVARLEIVRISYTGTLQSFTLEGIYINDYYQKLPLSLDAEGRAPVNNGSEGAHYTVGDPLFQYNAYSTLYDILNEDATGNTNFTPENGVWAYQVFGDTPPVPHIILKLTDVTNSGGANIGTQYVTVAGYLDDNNVQVQSFGRNTVYKITNLAFTDGNIDPVPEPETINIFVHVEVEPWSTVNITPDL